MSERVDHGSALAHIEFDGHTATVEGSELYQRLLETRPERQGRVEWNEGRNRTVQVPFKSYWAVTDATDEIQTAEVRWSV